MGEMGTCIGKLALSSDFSDVRFIVGQEGAIFPAHKLILAARSEYFRKMFYGVQMRESKDSTCSFPDDDPSVFKTMLYHLYERPLEFVLEPRHVGLCLVTSEKYRIDTFRDFCLKTLRDMLSVRTACEIATILEDLHDSSTDGLTTPLAKACEVFVVRHLEEIINSNAHLSLSDTLLERLLQQPTVNCRELTLFNAVITWHAHHFESYQTNRPLLLRNLSLIDLRSIELQDVASTLHQSGVFTPTELAELYKARINLGHFGCSTRAKRRCALMFHAGAEYSTRTADVLKSLNAAGCRIDPSDVINFEHAPAESAQKLMDYSVVLVFSMETRSVGMCGDILADYVDKGGCIVLCHALGCMGGRLMTQDYMPVQRVGPNEGEFVTRSLGKVLVDNHPLFAGVTRLKVRCGPNFVWSCTVGEHTRVLANWDDGTVLACERMVGKGRVVMLNLYPVSTRVVVVGIDKEGDGHVLLRNALMYAAYKPHQW